MTYTTLSDLNASKGPETVLQAAAEASPFLPHGILIAFYLLAALGSYFVQQRLTGRGDFAASIAVAGFVTFISAILMSMVPDFMTPTPVIISAIVAIAGVAILYGSKREQ